MRLLRQVEINTGFLGFAFDAGPHFLGVAAILGLQHFANVDAFGRHGGIEIEGVVFDDDINVFGKLGEGLAEPGRTDEAPGAYDIGKDVDLESASHRALQQMRLPSHGIGRPGLQEGTLG
jgi:hypothetical protein